MCVSTLFIVSKFVCKHFIYYTPAPRRGRGYTVLPLSVRPSVFRRTFFSNCWWQKSDIWSQALYMYAILWEAFLDPSDSYFLFADLVGFLYTLNIYAHFSSHFSQQLLMTGIWYLVTSFIYVCHIVGSVFGSVRFLLPVCQLSWFLYTLNIYAHFSSHFSQQLLMTGIWYLFTSFIYVCHIVGSVFGPVRFLLPVCRLS